MTHQQVPDIFLERLKSVIPPEFYLQSLSSMLAVQALDPQPGERILDLCAAPGSKTSQTAARMNNTGSVTAVEAVRGRFYQLRSVLRLLGVENVQCLCMDGRRFAARGELFDRVLVDAPCSSEGRFRHDNAKTFAYWSLRKIKEMAKKQRGLLLNAGRQVRPGGVLVYSTCTFAPEENEAVVNWFLKKSEGIFTVEPVSFTNIGVYPALTSWEGKTFDSQVQHCMRILPGEKTEGFFIAKFSKQ
jgi:16S rRNA (cytosine1407-C5)-methyltransferase